MQELSFQKPMVLAIAEGATTPNPGQAGVSVWSSTLGKPVYWTGTQWTAVQGTQGPAGQSGVTASEGVLSANVTMTTANTFYDGPTLSLAAGTYVLTASITVKSANATAQRVTAKLWDGTTVYASSEAAAPSQGTSTAGYINLLLVGMITLAATTTVKVSATSTAASSVLLATPGDNATGATNTAANLVAMKIA